MPMLRGLRYSWENIMDIRPGDLPGLRDKMIRVVEEFGESLYGWAIENDLYTWIKEPSVRTARDLAANEIALLRSATLFHASEEMVGLAEAASSTLPDFRVAPEDVPAPYGFMVLAKPLRIPAATFHAVGWRVVQGRGLLISWYAPPRLGGEFAEVSTAMRESFALKFGPVMQDRDSWIPFDMLPEEIEDAGVRPVEKTLKSLWLLMQQPLASETEVRYDRAALRRFARNGQEPPRVRILTLRRMASPNGDALDADREYHHQWIVRGHWRQQWYPARQVHRPVWIAPHIKGPEGAPLLGGEKVYALRR